MATHRVLLHEEGPALWPERKPLSEVLALQEATLPLVWSSTYQGTPTPPGGTIFMRDWWLGRNRLELRPFRHKCLARYTSWDTGLKDNEDNAYSAYVTGEILPDYRLFITEVGRDRLLFPHLPDWMARVALHSNRDQRLQGVIIEDKASGTSAYQTLRATSDDSIKHLMQAFMPTTDKITRAKQASVWCHRGMVLLPMLSPTLYWLIDFEDEIFKFPQSVFKDMTDAFSQLILYLEHYLEAGWSNRS